MEYYANNIWVVENSESERFHSIVSGLPELADKGAESHIAEKGSIRNSWLASGVEVEGLVEDSIIFPTFISAATRSFPGPSCSTATISGAERRSETP